MLLAVGAWCVYGALDLRYRRALVNFNDICGGLSYYMETYGRFPESREAFLSSPFIDTLTAGEIVVRPQQPKYWPKIYGWPIEDLAAYEIAWGIDIRTLRIDGDRTISSTLNGEIIIAKSPFGLDDSRAFTRALVKAAGMMGLRTGHDSGPSHGATDLPVVLPEPSTKASQKQR